MKSSIHKALLGLLVVAFGACGNSGIDVNRNSGGKGGKGSKGSAGAGGTAGGTGGTGAVPGGGAGGTGGPGTGAGTGGSNLTECSLPIPVSSQIPRIKRAAYDQVVKDLLGIGALTTRGNMLPSEMLPADSDDSLTDIGWNAYLATAEAVASELMTTSDRSRFITCDPAVDSCLMQTIQDFGRKAFRRPLTPREVASFMRLDMLTPKGTPDEVAEAILRAMLSSPSFILLPELGEEKDGVAYKLTNHEVAARLSFLLWNSIPDDILNTEADNNRLQSRESILAQARRMVRNDRAKAVAVGFHRYWAGITGGTMWASKGTGLSELDAFFADAVLTGKSFKELFLSNAGFVTQEVAAAYGLDPGAFTREPKPVALDPTMRPGFLTRVGFLTNFSRDKTTSPTQRGSFIMSNILDQPVGPPDPSFMAMAPPPGQYTNQRQVVEALTSPATCRACHAIIDAPGFVLETYDAAGAWQTMDPLGGKIDATAMVKLSATSTKTISSPLALMTEIALSPEAQQHYGDQFLSFATGRATNSYDACVAKQLATRLAKDGYSLADMMVDYTQADAFRLRMQDN